MARRILITGASGFIGKNTVPFLRDKDLEIFGTYYQSDHDDRNVNWVKCNLLDRSEVHRLVHDVSPHILLHLAWNTEPSNYNGMINFDWLKASISLLEAFQKAGGERVVMVGSGIEYDWSYGVCTEHKTPLGSSTVYGSCKNLLFEYSTLFCKQYDISMAWPRIFFTYGPYENPKRLVPYVITRLMKNEVAEIRSGNLYRDYIYVKDIGKILSKLIDIDFEGPINVGTGKPAKLGDMVDQIGQVLDRKNLLKFNPDTEEHPKVVVANTEILNSNLFNSFCSFEKGLEETLKFWYGNNSIT